MSGRVARQDKENGREAEKRAASSLRVGGAGCWALGCIRMNGTQGADALDAVFPE
jgi:hypothetical protein